VGGAGAAKTNAVGAAKNSAVGVAKSSAVGVAKSNAGVGVAKSTASPAKLKSKAGSNSNNEYRDTIAEGKSIFKLIAYRFTMINL
jgi:hypothetical protein